MELIADGMRKPPVNRLDEYLGLNRLSGWRDSVITKLANGDVGLAIKNGTGSSLGQTEYDNSTKYPAFSIGQESANVVFLGGIDSNAAVQPLWAEPFNRIIDDSINELRLENEGKTYGVQVIGALGKSTILHREPMNGNFDRAFPGNIFQLVQRSDAHDRSRNGRFPLEINFPENFTRGRSVHPFVMGDIRGAVLIEQLLGREKFSTVHLVFFERDGIKSIPLRFEPKPDELIEIKQYVKDAANLPNDSNEKADRWMMNAVTALPSWKIDGAWGLDGALVISVAKINALWFLTREEVKEARKCAKNIGANPIARIGK